MSGGHFDGKEFWFEEIEIEIIDLIKSNYENLFSQDTIKQFMLGAKMAAMARVYARRIDYLVSGDDGEEVFHKRLSCDIKEVEERYANKV
jgi:hypothetical protein